MLFHNNRKKSIRKGICDIHIFYGNILQKTIEKYSILDAEKHYECYN